MVEPTEVQRDDDSGLVAVAPLDAAAVLDTLAERPLTEHAEVYETLHSELQRTLAEIDGG